MFGEKPDAARPHGAEGRRGQKSVYPSAMAMETDEVSQVDLPQRRAQRAYQDELTVIDVPIPRRMLMEQIKEKWDSILILIVLLSTLLGIINPRFDVLESRFDTLEAKLYANTIAITELDGKIDAVETKFDNKFNNLADMMIVAHTNGNVTEEELAAIWERVIEP